MLQWATLAKQYKTCKFLLDAGADPDLEEVSVARSTTRLWDYTLRGKLTDEDQDTVRGLLDYNDYVDDRAFSIAHKIVLGLSLKSLEEELTGNPTAVFEPDVDGRTALFWAAGRGDERATAILLRHGSDPRAMDRNGITPLYLAAENEGNGAVGCMRLLLNAGALPDPVSPPGVPTRSSPLLCAASQSDDPMTVKILLDFGANVNSRSSDGESALLCAARSQTAVHALMQLEHGADLNARSNDDKTPLTRAIVYNNHGVLKTLLDHWYMYGTCPRLAGPDLLGVIADYADIRTIHIFARCEHLKMSSEKPLLLAADASARVRRRDDVSDELVMAFDQLLGVLGTRQSTSAVELHLEAGVRKDIVDSSSEDEGMEMFEDAIEQIVREE